MLTYLVGGAVRDKLLGVPCRDRDFLVIGASPQEMLQKGFIEIGKSFTIFLHPESREEYTLAQNLEQDLGRRDLTINALALDPENKIIDLFGGLNDLQNKVLKHVHADNFFEDPLRLYRVARLKCQYPEFSIHPSTLELMQKVSQENEFKSLSVERIFAELNGALLTERPSVFFQVLKEVHALEVHFPELAALIGVPQRLEFHPEGDAWVHTLLVLDEACRLSPDILVRFASLMHDLGKGITPVELLPRHHGHEATGVPLVEKFGKRLLIPNDWLEAAITVTRFHLRVHRIDEMKASSIVKMFYEMDAFRKPYLVHILALASEADELGKQKPSAPQGKFMEQCFNEVMNVSSKDVPSHHSGKQIGEAIQAERVHRLKAFLKSP